MEFEDPETEQSRCHSQARDSERAARAPYQEDESSNDGHQPKGVRLQRPKQVTAEDVLHTRRASAERARDASQRSQRTWQPGVTR